MLVVTCFLKLSFNIFFQRCRKNNEMEKKESDVNLESKQVLDDISEKTEKNLQKVAYAQYSHEVVQNLIDTRDRYVVEDALERSAHTLVDDVIRRASNHIQIAANRNQTIERHHTAHDIQWPTIGEFTVNTGKRKIEEYIKVYVFNIIVLDPHKFRVIVFIF